MDYGYVNGDTDSTIYFMLVDSTTGLEKTGLTYNSSGVKCSWTRNRATESTISLVTLGNPASSHADGGFIEVDATNAKGLYRLDLPDSAVAAGDYLIVHIFFTGVKAEAQLIPLSARSADVTKWLGGICTATSITGVPKVELIKDSTSLSTWSLAILTDTADMQPKLGMPTTVNGISADIAAIPTTAMRGTDSAATPANVATALTDIHLDHLLAVDYDPASKPGTSTALLNEIVESDSGVSRFTTNALEQAPSGGGGGGGDATEAKQDTIIADLANGTDGLGALKTLIDTIPTTAMRGTDSAALASVCTEVRLATCTDWINGGRLDLLIDAIPTTAMRGTDSAYTGTPPTVNAIADQVWDELQSAHVTVGSFGIIATEIAAIPTTAMRGTDSAATSAALATAQTDITQIKGDLPGRITKNVALANFPFVMILASDDVTPATGLSVSATRSIDGAAFASCANSVIELANGWYKISLDASDLNGDTIALRFTAATANDQNATIITQP